MVVLAKDFYRVAAPSTLAEVPGRKWLRDNDEQHLQPAYGGFNHRARHEVEMQAEALEIEPRWGKHGQSRSLNITPQFADSNSSAPSTPHEEGGSEENADMGQDGDWHDAEDELEGPSPKAWRSSTVYATQDGALVGGRGEFSFPQSSGHSVASGSTEGEEVRDALRWHSESSESTDSKFLKGGPPEAAVQDANEKVRKWRGEHLPVPSEGQDTLGAAGGSILEDDPQSVLEVDAEQAVEGESREDNAAEAVRCTGREEGGSPEAASLPGKGSQGLGEDALESTGGEAEEAVEELLPDGERAGLPDLDRRRSAERLSKPFGSFIERPVLVEEMGERDMEERVKHERGKKEARSVKDGERERKDAKLEKKASWKKKASALFRSDTIQRIRSHRQQEKAKAQQESVAEDAAEGVPDPGRPVILELSADGQVELGPVEPVQMAEPPPKVGETIGEKEGLPPLAAEPDSADGPQVGGVTIKVKHVKVHRSGEEDKKPHHDHASAVKSEAPLVEEQGRPAPKAGFDFEKRSRSVERSLRSKYATGEAFPRRASSRERTPEKVHRGSRRHHRGEEDPFKSPHLRYERANGGADVSRSTGETDLRQVRANGLVKEDSVDFQAIIRTQRAAWEREREKWRAEIAGLQAQLEQVKADGAGRQNASDGTGDGLAAPEQSDSPRIHSFSSPKVNGIEQSVDSATSSELPARSRGSLGRSAEGLRVSGGSLHSQTDPLRRSTEAQTADHMRRSADLPPLVASTESSSLARGVEALQRSVSEQFSRRSTDKLRGLSEPLRKSSDGEESSSVVLTVEKAVQTGPVEGGEASYLAEENERLRAEVARLRDENSAVSRQMEAKKFNSYGNAAFNGQKYDEAVQHYSLALDARANDVEFNAVLYCNRATVQSALAKHMDALSDCLAALETDPRYTRAYMKKADVLTAVGDYEGALEDLSKLEPSDEVAGRVKDLRRRMKRAVAPMDYYAVLGVAASSSMADIKAAYRKLAMRYHPDRPGCNQGVIFQYISQAYQILSDAEARLRFDQLLEKSGGPSRK
ncbi:heat shock protein DnaJ with tetratricopeptide repeat [Klebsormidium nitens]|uniref:Heat shock protein DnaJ with tetratricopeptide repeat n=1 Tax=Klebsormidium nitens TaxID=105231 RepID=A0A1Y1HYT4_KLENI|nr:heat shock protein DnaJ with tetratricopeptide repeat [Klebsormidium nitens]|eukprot:GAQ82101.1 heat shock protein DnaJ with tetratricopeptide repeat [Klebsormidium nitens]